MCVKPGREAPCGLASWVSGAPELLDFCACMSPKYSEPMLSALIADIRSMVAVSH